MRQQNVAACGGGVTTDTVSEQSEMWLDRFAIDLSEPETEEGRRYLRAACDEAESWHNTRADRNEGAPEAVPYLESWIVLAEICNQALFDNDWEGAAVRLDQARP